MEQLEDMERLREEKEVVDRELTRLKEETGGGGGGEGGRVEDLLQVERELQQAARQLQQQVGEVERELQQATRQLQQQVEEVERELQQATRQLQLQVGLWYMELKQNDSLLSSSETTAGGVKWM